MIKVLFYFILINLIKRCDVKNCRISRNYIYKKIEFFKFFDIKRKVVIKLYIDDFFEHFNNNNNFDILLKARRI